MSDPAGDIFRALIAERSGVSAFDETAKVVALRLSEMLAGDQPLSAPALNALLSLLPPKASDIEPPWDLTKLTDKELNQLDRLAAKATGTAPPTPQAPHRFPKRSYRQLYVDETACLLDQIEGEALHRQRKGEPIALSDEDVLHIRCALEWLLVGLPTTPGEVFRYLIENAQYEVRKGYTAKETAALPASPAAPAVEAAAASNVIQPPIQTWGVSSAPRVHVGRQVW